MAQRAGENAVTEAGDAFGTHVGLESVGIYTDRDTRGFNPLDAGNARIEGIYYDPVGNLSGRLRSSTTIRVGTAAEGFPFNAPTGIADYKLRPFPTEFGNSISYQFGAFDGCIRDWDLRLPIVPGKIGLTGGLAMANLAQSDGSWSESWGYTVRPIFRFGGVELAPFASDATYYKDYAHPLIVLSGADLPDLAKKRRYLGQDWAKARHTTNHLGVTLKARITDTLSLRAGLFRAEEVKKTNYSDIFYIVGPGGQSNHLMILDPPHERHSTSGEAIFAVRLGDAKLEHRFFAGYRARSRYTETGGSQLLNFDDFRDRDLRYGELDPIDEPDPAFSAVSIGRVRQSSLMLGYIGSAEGLGRINLGIQKARYRAKSRDGVTGLVDTTRADPWLYNATVTFDLTPALSLYLGTERGLEDRGVAPETAANRNEQLPATLATQYEGGIRWKFHGGQLVVNAFRIAKPYFSYDVGRFVELGDERHLGVEASLSGNFDRFSVVAGAVIMKRDVVGSAVDDGRIGKIPTGTPAVHIRIDANYRTDLLGGITPLATLNYSSSQAAGSRPVAGLGGHQVMIPGFATVDLGLREKFEFGRAAASIRALVENVFDKAEWKVAAADTLLPDERRRFVLQLTTDF